MGSIVIIPSRNIQLLMLLLSAVVSLALVTTSAARPIGSNTEREICVTMDAFAATAAKHTDDVVMKGPLSRDRAKRSVIYLCKN